MLLQRLPLARCLPHQQNAHEPAQSLCCQPSRAAHTSTYSMLGPEMHRAHTDTIQVGCTMLPIDARPPTPLPRAAEPHPPVKPPAARTTPRPPIACHADSHLCIAAAHGCVQRRTSHISKPPAHSHQRAWGATLPPRLRIQSSTTSPIRLCSSYVLCCTVPPLHTTPLSFEGKLACHHLCTTLHTAPSLTHRHCTVLGM